MRRSWWIALLVGLWIGGNAAAAQGGPFSAQIQALLRSSATITGNWTCTGTCTGFNAGGGAVWGAITGTLSNQTDLQTALTAGSRNVAGSNTQVQFNDSGVFGADSGLTYVKASDALTVAGWIDLLSTGVRASAADGVLTLLGLGNGNDENLTIDLDNAAANTIALSSVTGANLITWTGGLSLAGASTITTSNADGTLQYNTLRLDTTFNPSGVPSLNQIGIYTTIATQAANTQDNPAAILGTYTYALHDGDGDLALLYGVEGDVYHEGTGTIGGAYALFGYGENKSTGIITSIYGAYLDVGNSGGGSVGTAYGAFVDSSFGTITGSAYGVFVANQTVSGGASDYAFWYAGGGGDCNGGGVWRVKADGTVAQYNPCFTAYTPDATNFERIVQRWGDTGVFGTDNLAYLGVEVGGSGTNRVLNLLGSSIGAMSVPGTYTGFTAASYSTGTNCADAAGDAACGSAAAGAVVVDATDTNTVISTTAVTATSRIFVTDDPSLATELGITCNATVPTDLRVTARSAGTSFTITVTAPVTNKLCVSYWIVN